MGRMSRTCQLLIAVSCLIFGITGCKNGNLFGGLHNRGDSGSIDNLLSDAQVALRADDYAGALALYNRVLAQDSDNSLALYGAAAAAIGSSGLNIGQLLANVTNQSSAPSFHNLTQLIGQSRQTVKAAVSTDPNSLLNGIDMDALDTVIDKAICRLTRIVAGATDGTIKPNDIDVILNLASLCVIRASSNLITTVPSCSM